ncbi:MAG TPA: hypothetical protein VJR89_05150 [Polyangiales bacterium]|nr:hypothetical protein [Polyangiales bacterium]
MEYERVHGCTRTYRKHLLTTERLEIEQTLIRAGDPEEHAACSKDRAVYVLAGSAVLQQASHTEISKGQLVLVPAGARWEESLSLRSAELVLLEISRAGSPAELKPELAAPIRAIDPKRIATYAPAGHAKTQNRCLFIDEHMEIIEGVIERGGGAERHSHPDHEQLLYVLSGAGVPLLIYYPKGAPHGTGGGIAEPLELLVIYSPPLGEPQNALA